MTPGQTMGREHPSVATFRRATCALGSALGIALAAHTDAVRASVDPAALTYLPARHEFAGSTQYTFVNSSGDVTSTFASPSYSYELHTQVISQSLSYGFTNALSLSLGLAHNYVAAGYDFDSGGHSSASDSAGHAYLSLTYRLIDQSSQPFNLDLSAGNAGASAAVSYEAGEFEILGRAGVYHARGGTGFDPVLDVNLTTPEVWGYVAELRSQFRVSPRWSLNLGAAYTSSPFGSRNASIGASSFQLERADAFTVGLAAIYQIVPSRFAVRLGYQHSFIGQRRDEYSSPTRDVVAGNQQADSVGLALIYRF